MDDLKNKLVSMLKDDLAEIEKALSKNLDPYFDIVSKVAGHILFSGGKRLRPLLLILCARLCNHSGENLPYFSTVPEYVHAATLLHDDLIDEAKLRHNKPVANSVWGNSIAVLTGDFLLARSLAISAQIGNLKIVEVIAEVTQKMSEGEIFQLYKKGNIDLTEEEYFEIIKRKTAILFEGSCKVGAMMAKASMNHETNLSTYGFNLGLAFQMADDLLDYTSDTKTLGKNIGTDLKEGKLTLPVIIALKNATPSDSSVMKKIIKDNNFSDYDFNILVELLNRYEGISYTSNKAYEYILKAKEAISMFPMSKTKEILLMLADYVLARKM